MSGQIFISYRRDDASYPAGRLYDRLSAHFPENQIFMDVDNLDPGVDFVEAIETSVGSCEVLIAVIGKRWLVSTDEEGKRRLDNPDDFVRLEIATALKRNIRVIPVLVDGALMPRSNDVPDDLKLLVRRNALEVSHNRFNGDLGRLITAIERVLEKADAERKQREEHERLAAEQRQREEKERSEAERLQREENERLEGEQRQREDKERLGVEQRQREEKQRLEAGRIQREEKDRLEAESREKERLEAEQREKQRLETGRRAREEKEQPGTERRPPHHATSQAPAADTTASILQPTSARVEPPLLEPQEKPDSSAVFESKIGSGMPSESPTLAGESNNAVPEDIAASSVPLRPSTSERGKLPGEPVRISRLLIWAVPIIVFGFCIILAALSHSTNGSFDPSPIFGVPFSFAFWCSLSWLMGRISGWRRIYSAYPARNCPKGNKFANLSGSIGFFSYGGALIAYVAPEGLRLSVVFFFKIGHPPILIPWTAIHSIESRRFLWQRYVKFDVGSPKIATICLPEKVLSVSPLLDRSRTPK